MAKERIYLCIDMKCFFASVECALRGLNPFETNLVVADESRGKGAICLAISPKMKSLGVRNRCRLYEIPENIEYIIAKPQMQKYIEFAADIYSCYLDYISKDDIHVYSIDESFLDVTDYLKLYNKTPVEMAKLLINEIAVRTHIPATCGIGTNLYLAKIALDITAKKSPEHIGYLDEDKYKAELWEHKPLNDFWQISSGTVKRLAKMGIFTMKAVAECPEELLYKVFGINAELLIDHAKGKESCTIADIKAYKSKSKSVSFSQILFEDYPFDKARLVIKEMVLNGCEELSRRHLSANTVFMSVGYSKDCYEPTGGSQKLSVTTNLFSKILPTFLEIYDQTTLPTIPIRRLAIGFTSLCDSDCEGYDLFTDFDAVEKEKRSTMATLDIKDKFGKNAIVRAMDLDEGATAMIRNKLIGGHNKD